MSRDLFEKTEFSTNVVKNCPHCGLSHAWSKSDAWFTLNPPGSPPAQGDCPVLIWSKVRHD